MTGRGLEGFQLLDSAKPASQDEKGTISISFAAEGAAKTHEYQPTAGLSSGKLLYLASCPKVCHVRSLPASVGESSRILCMVTTQLLSLPNFLPGSSFKSRISAIPT